MAVTIKAEGRASKRGMMARLPAPDRLIAEVRDWIGAEYAAFVRATTVRQGGSLAAPTAVLQVGLHPAADPVSITAGAEGAVWATADASNAGPGYQTFVARLLERMGEDLRVTWSKPAASRPDEGHRASGMGRVALADQGALADRGAIERDHLELLGRQLAWAAQQHQRGVRGVQVGLRPGTQFEFEGAIGTVLGPRDEAWLTRALEDLRIATEIRPWWTDAPDAHYMLGRALVLLWTEIRWRPPSDTGESATMDEALRLLRTALPADSTLPYPWREWAELIALRAVPDPIADRVARRAEQVDASLPRIGYRRRSVTITHEGWALRVPGSFSEVRTAEEWSGRDRGRMVTLAATTTRAADGRPQPAGWFLAQVASDLGTDTLHHEAGELQGVARLVTDASSGVEVAILEGFSAVPGSGAAIRIEFEEGEDYPWAIDLWRSLRPSRSDGLAPGP